MKASKLGLLSGALVLSLAACDLITGPGTGDDGPTISSFTANPAVISAGDTTTLSWSVDSTATRLSISPSIGTVTGTSVETDSISSTTVYTLTATDAEGGSSTATTTVTVEDGGSVVPIDPPVGGGPTGTFGVSETADGTFTNDAGENITSNDDERIISVPAGGTFYAEVAYADADGIADITLLLVNSAPADLGGELSETPQGGFTVGEPTGDCDLASTPTTVTCVYPITVAPGTPDIEVLPESGDEFAYVFRVSVEDTAGNESGRSTRGYVNIE